MVKIRFGRCDTSRIFTEKDICQFFGRRDLLFFDYFAVSDNIYRHGRINIADNIEVNFDIRVDFYYIFLSFFDARNISYHGNGAAEIIKMKKRIKFHTVARADMVDDKARFYAVYIHTFTPKSFIISAILIYLPLCACLK